MPTLFFLYENKIYITAIVLNSFYTLINNSFEALIVYFSLLNCSSVLQYITALLKIIDDNISELICIRTLYKIM